MTMSGRKTKPFYPGAMFMDGLEKEPEPAPRPWGIQAIGDMYSAGVQAGLPDGRWVAAVAEPYPCNLFESIRAAWWVLTGRAVAFVWPRAGDLEDAFKAQNTEAETPGPHSMGR